MLKEDCLYLSIFQKHGATSSDMSKNEEEMLLPSEENIIMEEEFYPSATYARGQRNTTDGNSDSRVSSSKIVFFVHFWWNRKGLIFVMLHLIPVVSTFLTVYLIKSSR